MLLRVKNVPKCILVRPEMVLLDDCNIIRDITDGDNRNSIFSHIRQNHLTLHLLCASFEGFPLSRSLVCDSDSFLRFWFTRLFATAAHLLALYGAHPGWSDKLRRKLVSCFLKKRLESCYGVPPPLR